MFQVEKMIPGGQSIATHPDGRKILLWNALPGEIVTDFIVTSQKSHYYKAIATKIAHPSLNRQPPKDSCYLSTSPWQILTYPYELEQKQALVQEIFCEHQINLEKPPIITDYHDFYYRNKMEYALYWNHHTQKIDLAFHFRDSHRKIPIQTSSLEQPEIFAQAQAIVEDLNAHHASARHYQSLLLRATKQGQISGGLYVKRQPHPNFPSLTDTILDRTYHYSPNGFFQINLPVYELALQEIQKHLTTSQVLDLYSGVGTIGLSVAQNCQNLTLVESDKYAFHELIQNLPSGDILTQSPTELTLKTATNSIISAILTKSEQALDFITKDKTIIFDPPRAGCHPALINKIIETKSPTLIYLSCNPPTQARDVKLLAKTYEITSVTIFNFFPRTPHLETLVVLKLK